MTTNRDCINDVAESIADLQKLFELSEQEVSKVLNSSESHASAAFICKKVAKLFFKIEKEFTNQVYSAKSRFMKNEDTHMYTESLKALSREVAFVAEQVGCVDVATKIKALIDLFLREEFFDLPLEEMPK